VECKTKTGGWDNSRYRSTSSTTVDYSNRHWASAAGSRWLTASLLPQVQAWLIRARTAHCKPITRHDCGRDAAISNSTEHIPTKQTTLIQSNTIQV